MIQNQQDHPVVNCIFIMNHGKYELGCDFRLQTREQMKNGLQDQPSLASS